MALFETAQTNFRRRLTRAIALPFILMLALSGILFLQLNHLLSVTRWVDHTDRVIAQANYTQRLLLDMESGIRGYLVTGNPSFLAPYQASSLLIDPAFNDLRSLISDNPRQIQRLKELRAIYEQWNRYAPSQIARKQRSGDYQFSVFNTRRHLMDAMRVQLASFIETEEVLRDVRTDTAQKTTQLTIGSTLGLTVGLGSLLALFTNRQLIAVAKTYKHALAIAQEQTEALRRSAQRLEALHQIDRAILAAHSPAEVVRAALSRMQRLVPCQQAFVVLFHFETGIAHVIAGTVNGDFPFPEGATLQIDEFLPGFVLGQQRSYSVENATINRCPPAIKRMGEGQSNCMTIPLRVEENLLGELILSATEPTTFNPEHQEIAREVADQLAIAMQQAELREQLEQYNAQLEQRVSDRTVQLQEANAELEAFAYSVSHDLRAPLRAMQGFSSALLEDYGDSFDVIGQDYAQRIVTAAQRMDILIQDLLDYSRLSRTEIRLQPIHLEAVVIEVLAQLEPEVRQKQVQVAVESPLPQVVGHRTTLIQVLTNLLNNAMKFIAPGVQPQVRVWAEVRERGEAEEQGIVETRVETRAIASIAEESESHQPSANSQLWVRLWIEDNGIGIAPEHQQRIFRVFERLHGIESYPGTGIGLAIVRKGLERMGGYAGVESQANQGSRFWIDLPKARDEC
ncbi:CHASE3 domain-containing protein [Coleofasciculus sp. FACHB-1120]|uniref:CHASE3 domain-containing protein n=1 Tax=Coleofasciculus sp. FACHB-1120 TaxID=2692783 RepID=UPI0016893D23|nr:CHASE3 domain-containing protein [Coleofasciculus sp. FACHB-1120]MBD2740161.1 CHASE3 domain-containing protein [Coleofasciculus sp. FACHB-1120]